jgi:hypothetical protein
MFLASEGETDSISVGYFCVQSIIEAPAVENFKQFIIHDTRQCFGRG